MKDPEEAALADYPHGRGYGHDYMRGGEVFGGYGYAERDEYAKGRGELGEDGGEKGPDPTESGGAEPART